MNDRPTPEADAHCKGGSWSFDVDFARKLERQRDEARDQLTRICREGFGYQDTISLEPCADYVLRKLNEERELARELRDALESCQEDSVDLAGQYHWKRGAGDRNSRDMAELDLRIDIANRLLTKAKEVLP